MNGWRIHPHPPTAYGDLVKILQELNVPFKSLCGTMIVIRDFLFITRWPDADGYYGHGLGSPQYASRHTCADKLERMLFLIRGMAAGREWNDLIEEYPRV